MILADVIRLIELSRIFIAQLHVISSGVLNCLANDLKERWIIPSWTANWCGELQFVPGETCRKKVGI